MRLVASKPSISGIWQSIKTTSKVTFILFNASSASRPDLALNVVWLFRCCLTITWLMSLSSTINTLRFFPFSRFTPEEWWTGLSRASSACSSIIVKENVLPWPLTLSSFISPPMSSHNCLLIERPRPVPPNLRVVERSSWVKTSKIVLCLSCAMPMPVSFTLHKSLRLLSAFCWMLVVTSIHPLSVNFTALPNKFESICLKRTSSPCTTWKPCKSKWKCSANPFSWHIIAYWLWRFSSDSKMSNGFSSICSWPASILEKSKISFTICKRPWILNLARDR